MGLWTERVVPRIANRFLDNAHVRAVRERVCAGLSGEVLEIGFGSGLNVPHYPPAVRSVAAVEPSELGWRLAGPRVTASEVPVVRSGLDGQSLPFESGSFDAALSTFTLCTIPDATQALAEVRRVLRPGGALHFVEHGRAPEERVRRWQARLNPVNRRIAGGCHLDRPIDTLLTGAGFVLERLDNSYAKGDPKPFGYLYEGVARR